MGIFSSSNPLADDMQARISPTFFFSGVEPRHQKEGLSKLASAQDSLRECLERGEEIVLITPCFRGYTGWDGIGILTNRRILHYKSKKHIRSFNISDLAETESLVESGGTFILKLVSQAAAPFAAYAIGHMGTESSRKYYRGTISLSMATQELLEEFSSTAIGIRDFAGQSPGGSDTATPPAPADLPADTADRMAQFGRYEFDPTNSGVDGGYVWASLQAPYLPLAQSNPERFVFALAEAVLPVGGWAAYGAHRTVASLLSPNTEHPAYAQLLGTALDFLRASGVPRDHLNDYEWQFWIRNKSAATDW